MKSVIFPVVMLAVVLFGELAPAFDRSAEELSRLGSEALRAGHYDTAEKYFLTLATQFPSATAFGDLGMSEAAQGKLKHALHHFQRSIELGNRSATVHYNLGLTYLRQHQYALGVEALRKALTIDPELQSGRYTLAVALLESGRPGEAIPFLSDLRTKLPHDPAVWGNLVRAQFENSDSPSALKSVDEGVDALPTNVPLIVTFAGLCSAHSQFQKALHLLENASELTPDDLGIKLLLAKASLEAKQPVEALAILVDVPSDYGEPGEISYIKGIAQALTGKYQEASREFSAAVSAKSRNVRYMIAQAWACQLEGKHDEALTILRKAQVVDPENPIAPYRMAVSFLYQHKYSLVVESCLKSLQLAERYHPAYLLMGVARLQQGDLTAAETAIRRALRLKPDSALYHRELGVTLCKLSRLQESRRELDDALGRDPKASEAYLWRARVFTKQRKYHEAIADLETAVALQPNNGTAYSELHQLYSKVGQIDKADKIRAKLKETNASDPDAHATFLSDFGDPL
jgi:tetratricopeptide (TPR) repeat protein